MLTPKPNNASTNRIHLVLRLNKTLPNIKEIVNKHWHLLQINPNHKNIVEEKPIIDYRRIRNLRELIGSNRTLNDRVVRKNNIEKKTTLLQFMGYQKRWSLLPTGHKNQLFYKLPNWTNV